MTMHTRALACRLFLSAALLFSAARADEAPSCKYLPIAELPLRYTGPSLQVTVDGVIDGMEGPMLLDTGFEYSVLTRTGSARRGMGLGFAGNFITYNGNTSQLLSTRVREVSVGPIKTGKSIMWVIGDMGSPLPFDAILGANFLLQYDLELSLPEKKVRFLRSKDCDEKSFLGYWSGNGDIFVIPFDGHSDLGPNPYFTVEVNGVKLKAEIDSGLGRSAITARGARLAGIGNAAPAQTAKATLKIGAETVENAEIGVIRDGKASTPDLTLGNDFLRAHRVLFAMSQKKLYLSYAGGEPFKRRMTVEPWLLQEAEGGNADAQMALASIYHNGTGVEKDPKQADAWLQKAAVTGSPQAKLQLGRKLMSERRYDQAALQLRDALDKLPAERNGALSLYLARLHTGQPDLGKAELDANFARGLGDDWPRPIADFALGRIDEARLFKLAAEDERFARSRTCSASSYLAELYRARGNTPQSDAMHETWRAQCAKPKQTASDDTKGDTE